MSGLEDRLLHITDAIERQVDATIEQIDNLNVRDIQQLRRNRLRELRKQEADRAEWLSKGHGSYEELPEEKMFFEVIKKSQNVVVHFYTNTSPRCRIVDTHLKILALKHLETRFISLNAEKSPFLAEKLKIKTIPTIVLVQNSLMVDKIVGFTQLGNRDDFTTEILEWRIAQNNIINYEEDLANPPTVYGEHSKSNIKRIRESESNKDDLDIEEYALKTEFKNNDGKELVDECKFTELTAEEAAELGLD